ncbi:McrB family protein [Pontibacter oryzae]|uniref:Restriction endonuclease n=1 Tax=Pontibacter oryzae TaxID=2304593 RepID=A0A399SLK3_9BACT|nr:AAA family ATPase [Pontibacter oryzae]RIJ42655.1 restriction endonuclease [Pontibacter oryzae]
MAKTNTEYFIFANYPTDEYGDSIWDTKTIIQTREYYFRPNVRLANKPKVGDKIILKEFETKVYWGEAIVAETSKLIISNGDNVFLVKICHIKKWLYNVDKDRLHSKISNKDTRGRIVSITEQDYLLIKQEMENNSVLSEERQDQLKQLWIDFNVNFKEDRKAIEKKHDATIESWHVYKNKIIDGSFSLDDYTNTLSNSDGSLEGGYLCNFLERSTRSLFGSSKPGTAINFGVKLNSDNTTYTIGKNNPKATREEAEKTFDNEIKPLFQSIVKATNILEKVRVVESSNLGAKQILRKLAVLDHQTDFIYVYSDDVINELYSEFINGEEKYNLGKNATINSVVQQLFDLNDSSFVDQYILSSFLWMYSNTKGIADDNTPNAILYGPPGTGKTYAVQQSLNFVCQGDRDRYEMVQFHPSFTYEDFIEGIKPKGITDGGNIKFELVDGVFKRFCKKAKKQPHKKFYFVVDEINRANLSSVFGETLSRLEKDYRHDVISNDTNNLIKTQYSTLIEQLEKEVKTELAYELIDDNAYFGVPSNVYFIGMMNDVDKNIDAFDLALRRRFKWIRKDCNYDVVFEETKFRNGSGFDNIETYVEACEKLNNHISNELGLGKSYEFGHSFFMKMTGIAKHKLITPNNIEQLFELHLRPTLKEYLRALYPESELDKRLDESLAKFKQPFSKK